MPSETRRNLETMIGQYKTMHRVETADSPTHIPEVLSEIILGISARKESDIASFPLSISNFLSFMSFVFGLIGTITLVIKYL